MKCEVEFDVRASDPLGYAVRKRDDVDHAPPPSPRYCAIPLTTSKTSVATAERSDIIAAPIAA